MPRKSIDFELDFMIKDIFPRFTVKQFDDVSFNIKPLNQGLDYDATGMTGKIFVGVNNDIFMQTTNITVSSNNINVLLDKNMLQKSGRAYAEIELTDKAGTITSSSFIFDIDPKIGEGATIPGGMEGFIEKYNRLIEEFKLESNTIKAELQDITESFKTDSKTMKDNLNSMINEYDEDYNSLRKIIIDENASANLQAQINKLNDGVNKIVKNEAERDKLEGLKNGVICYVTTQDMYYKYKNGLWEIFQSGTGGGGGTGGGSTEVTLSTSMDNNLKVALGNNVNVSFDYDTTGSNKAGRLDLKVNGISVKSDRIMAGSHSFDISNYVKRGANAVEITVTDSYGSSDFLIFNIDVIDLSISSTFDNTQIFENAISFNYNAKGNIAKNLYVKVDGNQIHTEVVTTNGVNKTVTIPKQSHGEHVLEVYIEANLEGNTIKSNVLKYHIICADSSNDTTIIASSFDVTNVDQYTILSIPYMVYSPNQLTANVDLYVNDEVVSSVVVDRKLQNWNLSEYPSGEVKLKIQAGEAFKEFVLNVEPVELDITEKTDGLELYLTSKNRINDNNKDKWEFNTIKANFSNFNWITDGWQLDKEGLNVLTIQGDNRVEIPLKIFEQDFKNTGKAVEFEFEVKNVTNYEDVIISCMSDNRGLEIGCKSAKFKSNEMELLTNFKDNERIRVAFSIESKYQNSIVSIYVNGVLSGLAKYTDTDIFSQSNPVNITIGNNSCTTNLYNIRVYNQSLTVSEALNNYIFDMNNPSYKIELYSKNNIYDEYGEISYYKLSNQIPCMTITGEMPSVKGDKKLVNIKYENKQDPTKDFNDSDVKIDIQGTSSQYYPKKNYKFTLNNSYKLRDNSISEKVFCVKADYMESSHSHNTGMAKIVHNTYLEKVPPQHNDSNIRTTIDGFPIAMFYRENENAPLQYFGIYNFNNDKDDVNTFGYGEGTECWEVCNNTSPRVLFKQSEYESLDNEGKPAWLNDFEARYPEDNVDYTNLKRLTDWIVSTEGNIDKFKNEFNQYFNLHYTTVYFILTELFAMVDSRAKNMFLATWDKNIWYPVFYDMDTCFGLNNEGVLAFNYNVESTDTLGTQNVYNGKDSLLWNNFREAFANEIKDLYNELRDKDIITYEKVLDILEGEQIARLCEAQYNEDARYKYLDPLLNENISTYLYIAQGNRINHLKYWLFNRFNYMDSKYMASDYKNNYATMRLYTPSEWVGVEPNASFEITPFANQYATVKFGSYVVSDRAKANESISIVPPDIQFNDTETIIYGADRIASLGDLSNKYAGTVDMSKAAQLTELIIGSSVEGYKNENLHNVSVGNNKLLRKIDVRNCPNLTQPLDLSNCDNIEEVYASGTSITSVKLSNGGELRKLSIPNTVTNITLINKNKLENIDIESYDNLNTLRIENSIINPFNIISKCNNLEFVRLINIDCQTPASNIQSLMSYKGINEEGIEIPIGQAITGKITITQCSEDMENEFKEAFPYVEFKVLEYIQSFTVNFIDGDGNTLYTQKVLSGGEAKYVGEAPTKTSDAQYHYVFKGWDRQLKPILSNVDITATFDKQLRYYTIRFINSDTQEVISSQYLAYGSTPVAPGLPEGFNGWKPMVIEVVTRDKDYYTQYVPYPEDLSIFEFTYSASMSVPGKGYIEGYTVSLKTNTEMPSYVIFPFEYEGTPVYCIKGNSSYSSDYQGKITDVYIPESIATLDDYAFKYFGCSKLIFPNSVRWLGASEYSIAQGCFNYCAAEEIVLPGVQRLNAFTGTANYGGAFAASRATYITLGSPEYPFNKWSENSASSRQNFYGASVLSNGGYVNLITENGVFEDISTSRTPLDCMIITKTPIERYSENSIEYLITEDECFVKSYGGDETEIEIPSTIKDTVRVTRLSNDIFKNNTSITKFVANSILNVGNNCFYGCTNLTSIELPSVTSLGDYCFYNCTSLASIELPSAISLGGSCFDSCTNLTSIEIPNSVTSIGANCFYGCTKLTSIEIPNGVASIGGGCFYKCSNLISIKISNSVTSLGDNCFYSCSKLTSIEIGALGFPVSRSDSWGSNFISNSPRATVTIFTLNGLETDLTGSPWGGTNCTFIYEKA